MTIIQKSQLRSEIDARRAELNKKTLSRALSVLAVLITGVALTALGFLAYGIGLMLMSSYLLTYLYQEHKESTFFYRYAIQAI